MSPYLNRSKFTLGLRRRRSRETDTITPSVYKDHRRKHPDVPERQSQTAVRKARNRAGGITSAPHFRKTKKVRSSRPLRMAISQRIVASEPVTERFGPRSTPIR